MFKELNGGEATAASTGEAATAVHGLFRVADGLRTLTLPPTPSAASEDDGKAEIPEPSADATDGWKDKAAEAKTAGGEAFKNKDFSLALNHYSAAIACTPVGDESLNALFS